MKVKKRRARMERNRIWGMKKEAKKERKSKRIWKRKVKSWNEEAKKERKRKITRAKEVKRAERVMMKGRSLDRKEEDDNTKKGSERK
jgi:hypothetical protein